MSATLPVSPLFEPQPSLFRKAYTSDLSDVQCELIQSLLVLPAGGRPRTTNMREVFNAIY